MKAFDTDILIELLLGNPVYKDRIAHAPAEELAIPIIAIEEIIRGRLNSIRQAEAGKSQISVEIAYSLFARTLEDFRKVKVLPLTETAEQLFQE